MCMSLEVVASIIVSPRRMSYRVVIILAVDVYDATLYHICVTVHAM